MRELIHIVSAEVVVLNEKNEILLIKDPKRGWEIPGGQVEKGEEIKVAAIREVKEETGLDIELITFCGIHQIIERHICNNIFLGKPIGGILTKSNESVELGFFSIEEGLKMITMSHIKKRIEHCLDKEKHPFILCD